MPDKKRAGQEHMLQQQGARVRAVLGVVVVADRPDEVDKLRLQ